jgi:hypothetical protein
MSDALRVTGYAFRVSWFGLRVSYYWFSSFGFYKIVLVVVLEIEQNITASRTMTGTRTSTILIAS